MISPLKWKFSKMTLQDKYQRVELPIVMDRWFPEDKLMIVDRSHVAMILNLRSLHNKEKGV